MMKHLFKHGETYGLAAAVAALLIALWAILGNRFYSLANLQSMTSQLSEFALLALAMSLAMMIGGIDLSIVSVMVLSAIVGASTMQLPFWAEAGAPSVAITLTGVVAAVLTALLCSLMNGLAIAKLSMPPILATLSTMIFFAGVAMVISKGQSVPVPTQELGMLNTQTLAGLPVIFFVIVAVFSIVAFALGRTPFGRRMLLLGENPVAAIFTALRNERVVIGTFLAIGLLLGIASVVLLAKVGTARVGFGESYLLQALLVAVLAGVDPYGGKGKVFNVFLALILLQALQSAFTIWQFSPFAKSLVWGSALLIIMGLRRLPRIVARLRPSPGPGPGTPPPTEAPDSTAAISLTR